EGGQDVVDCQGGEACAVIGHGVGNDELPAVEQAATGINDVRHVTFTLVFVGFDQRLAQPANDFGRIVQIQQECADAIFAHRTHALAEHEPAGFGFDRRPAVAHLDKFPGEFRLYQHQHVVPEVQMVGKHDINVFKVLPA